MTKVGTFPTERSFGERSSVARMYRTYLAKASITMFAFIVVAAYLLPLLYMVTTSFQQPSQVSDPDDAIAMTDSIMDHFGVAGGQYAVGGADPVVYHSQLRQTVSGTALPVRAIVLGGNPGQPVTLYYRHHGIGTYTAVPMTASGTRGGFRAEIPAADVSPDGIDYYLRAGAASEVTVIDQSRFLRRSPIGRVQPEIARHNVQSPVAVKVARG